MILLLAASCVRENVPGSQQNQDSNLSALEKKSVNTSEDAVQGTLVVLLDEGVADALAQGQSVAALSEACQQTGSKMQRAFTYSGTERERQYRMHRWYLITFASDVNVEDVAAVFAELDEVTAVEYNTAVRRMEEDKATEWVAGDNTVAPALPFNDPKLIDQWHYINNADLSVASTVRAGADVNVRDAWKLTTGDPSIIVAICDEAVKYDHPDLAANMWVNEKEKNGLPGVDDDGNGYIDDVHGYNFLSTYNSETGEGEVLPVNWTRPGDSGHGTHVAGVIAASNDNGIGISSIAGGDKDNPGVRIMSCQIFSGSLAGTVLDEVRAIKYAADNGAVILQCSWGYISGAANPYDWQPQFATEEQWKGSNVLEFNALSYFVHNAGSPDGVIDGGIIVFAAGNESAPAASYPAAYPDYISVAGTAGDYTPAVYTNYGFGTTISAPGGDWDYYYEYGEGADIGKLGCVLSTLPYNVTGAAGEMAGYGYMEGTSMACPHVSGVVALGLSYAKKLRKHFKAEEIKELLYRSASPIEEHWNLDTPKLYYKYVGDLSEVHLSSMDLKNFRGKMGHGQVNAYEFLKLIGGEDAGHKMTFPNVYVAVDGSYTLTPSMYFENGDNLIFTVVVDDQSIAKCTPKGKQLVFEGLKAGQTKAVITAAGVSQEFIITVREGAEGNGWL